MESGFYTTSYDQLSGWTEKKFQSISQRQTCTKRWTWSLVVCCPSDSLQPSEPGETNASEKYAQQIDEMHQKRQFLQLILVHRKGPVLLHDNARRHIVQPTLQKLDELGYGVLLHLPFSLDLSPTDYRFSKHLNNCLQGKHINQEEAENAFQEFFKS